MVQIKATGFGVIALKSGQIIHFDVAEEKAKKPDKRKLEADVDIEDAVRIKELGWGDFVNKKDDPKGAGEADRAELGEAVSMAEEAPAPEPGVASRQAPPANRDDPERNARLLASGGEDAGDEDEDAAAPKPKRKPAGKRKPAAKGQPAPRRRAPAPAPSKAPDVDADDQSQDTAGDAAAAADDPEAGPA